MYCNMCGKEIADDARFCNMCGAKVIMLEHKEPKLQVEKFESELPKSSVEMVDVEETKMSTAKQAVLIAGAAVVGSILALGILLFTISLIAYL